MNKRTREGFYMLWTIAILLCLAVSVFLLIWTSFVMKGSGTAQTAQAGDIQAAGETEGEQQPAGDGTEPVGDGTTPVEGETTPAEGAIVPAEDGTTPAEDTAVPAEGETTPADSAGVTLAETADAGVEYQDRLTFLGDSTTYGMYAYEVLPHSQVWTPASGTLALFNWAVETIDYYAPGSDTSQGMSIVDCAAAGQPEYLVVTLGLNGVASLDEQQFKQYYTDLIQSLKNASPNTRIICNSIYPVIDAQTPDGIKNDRINAANGWILEVAGQLGARYLNTHDALLDASGQLSTDYINPEGDGIHMNVNGYNAILQYIRTHAWQ